MARPETLDIEVVYALPEQQVLLTLQVVSGTCVGEVLRQADLKKRFPGLDLVTMPIGIFGQRVSADHVLRAGDRIEIYRPLSADPKLARRARVERQRRDGSRER